MCAKHWHKDQIGAFSGEGILKYSAEGEPFRLVAEVDQDLLEYYRWFIPKWVWNQKPGYRAHVSIVRNEVIQPELSHVWGKYAGKSISLWYSNFIKWDRKYIWVNVFSEEMEMIRLELGLTRSRALNPNVGLFHMTLGVKLNDDLYGVPSS